MSSKVFVSYRKEDDSGWAGRIADCFVKELGEDWVFFDEDSIAGGQDWEARLDEALHGSRVLVLVIGPTWVQRLAERRSTGEIDFHLREITQAISQDILVYPLLVNGAPPPVIEELPEELRSQLARRQWKHVHRDVFDGSMGKILKEIRGFLGPDVEDLGQTSSPAAAGPLPNQQVTVGERGTDTDYHEIADAIAAVGPGSTITVRGGCYRKPVVIDSSIELIVEDPGSAVLDCNSAACIISSGADVAIKGLHIKASARSGGQGVRVLAGELTMSGCEIRAEWTDGSTGLTATGAGTSVTLDRCKIDNVATGLHFLDEATARIERCRLGHTTVHGVVIEEQADPEMNRCVIADSGGSTVLVTSGAHGTIGNCSIASNGTNPTIEIIGGAQPTIRNGVGPVDDPDSVLEHADNLERGRLRARLIRSDKAQAQWTVHVHDGGRGTIENCDLGLLRTQTGGDPEVSGCEISRFEAEDQGLGTLEHCTIGQVLITSGANPRICRESVIKPGRFAKVKVTAEFRDGGLGVLEDCEITGRLVRDGSADPAVLITTAANPVLRRCAITNPGEGAVWVTGGEGSLENCTVRSNLGCPALVVDQRGSLRISEHTTIQGGVQVTSGGVLSLDGCIIESPGVRGFGILIDGGGQCVVKDSKVRNVKAHGIEVVAGSIELAETAISDTGSSGIVASHGATLNAEGCTIQGAGASAPRKVGRWVEARSEKIRGKTSRVVGAAPAILVSEGCSATFLSCHVSDLGDRPVMAPEDGVTFEDCTVNDEAYPALT